jgi:hypothetical protein
VSDRIVTGHRTNERLEDKPNPDGKRCTPTASLGHCPTKAHATAHWRMPMAMRDGAARPVRPPLRRHVALDVAMWPRKTHAAWGALSTHGRRARVCVAPELIRENRPWHSTQLLVAWAVALAAPRYTRVSRDITQKWPRMQGWESPHTLRSVSI